MYALSEACVCWLIHIKTTNILSQCIYLVPMGAYHLLKYVLKHLKTRLKTCFIRFQKKNHFFLNNIFSKKIFQFFVQKKSFLLSSPPTQICEESIRMIENTLSVCVSYNSRTIPDALTWNSHHRKIKVYLWSSQNLESFRKQGCQIFYENIPKKGVLFKFKREK